MNITFKEISYLSETLPTILNSGGFENYTLSIQKTTAKFEFTPKNKNLYSRQITSLNHITLNDKELCNFLLDLAKSDLSNTLFAKQFSDLFEYYAQTIDHLNETKINFLNSLITNILKSNKKNENIISFLLLLAKKTLKNSHISITTIQDVTYATSIPQQILLIVLHNKTYPFKDHIKPILNILLSLPITQKYSEGPIIALFCFLLENLSLSTKNLKKEIIPYINQSIQKYFKDDENSVIFFNLLQAYEENDPLLKLDLDYNTSIGKFFWTSLWFASHADELNNNSD